MSDRLNRPLDATQLRRAARRHLLAPAEDMTELGQGTRPLLVKGEGVYVFDAQGHKLIDGPAGMWCTQIGYQRKEIADALAQQAMQLCYNTPWYSMNGPSAELAQRIAEVAPGDLNRVFFTTGGSTAVDSALRFVQFYNNVLGRPNKKGILCRIDGYHGSTHLTAACSGRAGNRPNFDLALPELSFLSAPNLYRQPAGTTEAQFLEQLLAEFEDRLASIGVDNIGAFIAEPVLASGGILIPPKGYHRRILDICRRHDILYISDEVVTGFGRCGHWFASEALFDVIPDIITFAKGVTSGYVPLGGFVISDAVLDRVSGDNANGSCYSNGYTFSGHPVSCAAALANMQVFEDDQLLAHVQEIIPYFQERLQSLAGLPLVGDVRGIGLLGCIECAAGETTPVATELDREIAQYVDRQCYELGLIVRPIGSMCVLSPPLIITCEQIDSLIEILRASLLHAADKYAR